ncbi:MAG: VCBS repeat-containing protein [Pseudomonadales bacterium]|nr:VCBS repeat-containing protein [Pseudomonadales bacterium]
MTRLNLKTTLFILTVLACPGAIAQLMNLPGQFGVSGSGAATYTIPIQVPPGTAGMQPELSLRYSSQNGNGILGMGWSLTGLPTIQRCPRTEAQDSVKGSVNFDANDRFCLDGQRLVAISGTYGSNNTEYRTEIESFSKIVSYGTAGTGPQYFKVWTKSGRILEIGNSTDSRRLTGSTVISWHVNKISDRAGNYQEVTYQNGINGSIYPTQIDYTLNSGLTAYNKVEFGYSTTRPDQIPTYQAGALVKTVALLETIKTKEGSNLVHEYQISYETGASKVVANRISEIKLCDGGTTQQCLAATSFTWPTLDTNDPVDFLTPINQSSSGIDPGISIGDYNGDGLPDFLREIVEGYTSSSTAKYWMSTEPGAWESQTKNIEHTAPSDPQASTGFPLDYYTLTGHPADLDADGFTDMVIDEEGVYWDDTYEEWSPVAYGPLRESSNTNDGTGVQDIAQSGNGGANSLALPFGDMNGDGRDDLLYLRASPNGAIPYYSDGDGTYTAGSTISGLYSSATIYAGDFNGDGCLDILSQGSSDKIYFSCNASVSSSTVTDWISYGYKIVPADYNGDGNTDLLITDPTLGTSLLLSDGEDFLTQTWEGPTDWKKYQIHTGDFNGDKMADVALIAASTAGGNYGPTTTHKIYLSEGIGFESSAAETISNPSEDVNLARVHDFNGDGAADLWIKKDSSNYLYLTGYSPMLIEEIDDGLNQSTSISYDRLNDNRTTADIYTKGTSTSYPEIDVIGAQYVVSEVDLPNGIGGTNEFTYTYEGARFHQNGRGLLGFEKRIVNEPNNIVTTTTYEQDYPYIGLVKTETRVFDSTTDRTLRSITNTYANTALTPSTGGDRRYVKLDETLVESEDLGGYDFPDVKTEYTYDSYGNATDVDESLIVGTTTVSSTSTDNTYTNDTTNWFIGQLDTTQTVHAESGETSITRKASFDYDTSTGLLTQEVVEPDDAALKLTTDYTRDAFGNITKLEQSGGTSGAGTAIDKRTTSFTYDDNKRFIATIKRWADASGTTHLTESLQFDERFGLPTQHTDPGGIVTEYEYDGFGRLTKTIDPDGRQHHKLYVYCSGVNGGSAGCTINGVNRGAMQVITTPYQSNGTTVSGASQGTIYDKLGRSILEGIEFNSTQWSVWETKYDSLGRVAETITPYLLTLSTATGTEKQWTTYSYDELDRVTESKVYTDTSSPSYIYNTYDYTGLDTTIVLDDGGSDERTRVIKRNNQGLVYQVVENGGTTEYDYDPVGNIETIDDPADNTISFSYDTRGRLDGRDDPSLGNGWTFLYNVVDELEEYTDARGNTIDYEYDLLGRMTDASSSNSDFAHSYTYITAATNKGKLLSMSTSMTDSKSFTYDSSGRPLTTTIEVDNVDYTFTTTYNSDGLPATLEYPSGYKLSYEYNSTLKFLEAVNDYSNSNAIWTVDARDASLRYTQATNKHGSSGTTDDYQITRTFDDFGRIIATDAKSGAIADFDFEYDNLGNLTLRNDNNQIEESYVYDNFNRLTEIYLGSTPTLKQKIKYDSVGNITHKTKLGGSSATDYNTYTYASDPYSVSSISGNVNGVTNPSFSYDSNGNMTSGAGRTYTWYSFNKVKRLTEGGVNYDFEYDAEFQRVSQDDGTNTTLYLFDPISGANAEYVDKLGGTWSDYLVVEGERIGVRVEETSPASTEYFSFVHDNQGTISVVVDEAGSIEESYYFDVWGRRRNADGSDHTSGSLNWPTTRGYTGHEYMPANSMINMNARLYDPEIGRFSSADSIIPNYLNSQSLNRYSYVLNNPGTFTDPTGHNESLDEFVGWTTIWNSLGGGYVDYNPVGLTLDDVLWNIEFMGGGVIGGSFRTAPVEYYAYSPEPGLNSAREGVPGNYNLYEINAPMTTWEDLICGGRAYCKINSTSGRGEPTDMEKFIASVVVSFTPGGVIADWYVLSTGTDPLYGGEVTGFFRWAGVLPLVSESKYLRKLNVPNRSKPINLPSWKKIDVDINHISSGHMRGGSRVSPRKDLFPDHMTTDQVERAVREAYRYGKRLETHGDRVRVRGQGIEMWVNIKDKVIETAYPVK